MDLFRQSFQVFKVCGRYVSDTCVAEEECRFGNVGRQKQSHREELLAELADGVVGEQFSATGGDHDLEHDESLIASSRGLG